ncbi:Stealth CR1 domain-containing protein [Ralstonia solanacearum]|uniref:Stealth CR1 domain-containing protein n=1 Tax=Ralstonia solanacearum TaxID=305 RepID=UPI00351820B1
MRAHGAAGQWADHTNKTDEQPIDVVYLWVDGSDPQWQAKRQRALAKWAPHHADDLALYGNVLGRYRDNEELRFNLRALERFFPDHGHVYIVTDGQVPAWLRRERGISVVNHRDLIPANNLPVFDSGNIESYIHRIPGLSERFFYLNDDVFFGAPVEPGAWFGRQLTVAMEAAPAPTLAAFAPTETALVNAASLSCRWLGARYPAYRHDARLYAHAPRPMLRSAMFELERLAPELFENVRATTFRSWRVPPIVSDLVPRWMVHVGLARQRSLEHLHIAIGEPDAPRLFASLGQRFGRLPFFCINDTCDDTPGDDPRLRRVSSQLDALLPLPSRFEAGPCKALETDEAVDRSVRWPREPQSRVLMAE